MLRIYTACKIGEVGSRALWRYAAGWDYIRRRKISVHEGKDAIFMPVQTKLSAALSVRSQDDPSRVLLVRRPENDAEFSGMWGLPAASCRTGETTQDAARRIGIQKLGVAVRLGRRLATGTQERDAYVIQMSLYEAWLEDAVPILPDSHESAENVTLYTAWRWADPSDLAKSAARGSLCSRLLLESLRLA